MRQGWSRIVAPCAMLIALGVGGARADSPLDTAMAEFQLVPMGGETPPPFSLETLAGGKLSPGDLKGRAVLLYFWATW